MGLSLGVVVPDLWGDGGAERLALHCVRRWQDRHRITLYSRAFDRDLLDELGVSRAVRRRQLPRTLWPNVGGHPADRLLEGLLVPPAWSVLLDEHDVYLAHQWPTQRLERRPLVWYAHEAHRPSYDLLRQRAEQSVLGHMTRLLVPDAGVAPDDRYEIFHAAIRGLDRAAHPDRVVANSRFTAAELQRALGPREVDVVYPGVELPPEAPPAAGGEPTFLSVGSMTPHKRHRLAIEALLLDAGRLVLVGRGAFSRELVRMISRLGLEERVDLRHDVTDEALWRLYGEARAVVFTPVNEPFGIVALETLAAGRPLIAVDEGGFTEVVDSSCAMLVPPEPAAVAEAMRALLARPEEAERMGRAGRKLAERFSWERTARELEAILLETHRAARAERPAPPRPAPVRPGPEIGVRLRADFGDGFAEGAWRKLAAPGDMPRLGFYASHHETTLRRQLAEIEACGFDFVVLSLAINDHGLAPDGSTALRNALALAPELGGAARFAVELVLDGTPRPLLRRALGWLARVLRGHDAVIARDGRPLVLLRGDGLARRAAEHPDLCVVASPEPGAPGPLRAVRAGDGDAIDAELRAACESGPERVIVSSWNDHLAGDAVEPTVRAGDGRLEALRAALSARRAG